MALVGAVLIMPVADTQSPAGDLPQLVPGQSLGLALGMPTMPNQRDVGGYTTRDGKAVARGIAYRSDTFNAIRAEEVKKLERLAIKNAYDLRTAAEVKAMPDQLPPGVKYHLLDVLADDLRAAPAELEALLQEPKKANAVLGKGKSEAMFLKVYSEFITLRSAKQSYGKLFRDLADKSKVPAVFHCTTGKDRTGWTAAALLTLLGVPKDTVIVDYMRTNDYTLPQFQHAIGAFVAGGGERSIALAVVGVKPEYLEASFAEMQEQYGSIEKYFSDGLGIDAAGQQALRELFLSK